MNSREDEDDGLYVMPPVEMPWKSVILAALLTLGGFAMLLSGLIIWATYPDSHGTIGQKFNIWVYRKKVIYKRFSRDFQKRLHCTLV